MIGKRINEFVKSYGSTFMFVRRPIVHWICRQIAQIDEEEYKKCRGTGAYRKAKFLKRIRQMEKTYDKAGKYAKRICS